MDYFTLTQENETKGGNDFTFTSDWDCSSTVNEYNTLAVYKPFDGSKTKIWDMKLAVSTYFDALSKIKYHKPTTYCPPGHSIFSELSFESLHPLYQAHDKVTNNMNC